MDWYRGAALLIAAGAMGAVAACGRSGPSGGVGSSSAGAGAGGAGGASGSAGAAGAGAGGAGGSTEIQIGASLGPLVPFWRAQRVIDKALQNPSTWLLSSSDPWVVEVEPYLPQSGSMVPFTDTIYAVRTLGGWDEAAPDQDVVYRDASGTLQYRWGLLFDRLDPIATNGLQPVVVLDNVLPAFVASPVWGEYGQTSGPDDPAAYGAFIELLAQQLASHYASEDPDSWHYRVGTEPNYIGHWSDTVVKYEQTYDYVTQAIRSVFPSAKVGPGNFTHSKPTFVQEVLNHIATGTNYATGATGSPIDFVGLSAYANDVNNPVKFVARQSEFLAPVLPPALASTPKELMEFGFMKNELGQDTGEPGAFGAAWTLAVFVESQGIGVTKIAQMAPFSAYRQSQGGTSLLTGLGWVDSMLDRMIGGDQSAVTIAGSPSVSSTAVRAIGTRNDASTYVLVAVHNPDRTVSANERLDVTVRCSSNATLCSSPGAKVDEFYGFTAATSAYDVMWSDLKEHSGDLVSPDRLVGLVQQMASTSGGAYISANAAKYTGLVSTSLTSHALAGTVAHSAGNDTTITFNAPTPSVTLIRISPAP